MMFSLFSGMLGSRAHGVGGLLLFLLSSAQGEIAGTNFFPIGPAPIHGFFSGGVTGRASSMAINPTDPDDIWVGAASGGVWRSTDRGLNWSPMSDYEASLAIGALALYGCSADPPECAVVFAGTGENAIRRDTLRGAGLLIGRESGGTEFPRFEWTLVDGFPNANFKDASINDIVIDPTTSGATTRLFLTLSSGVTVGPSESTVTAPEPFPGGWGVFRSNDEGLMWEKLIVAGATSSARPTDLKMDPNDPLTLYLGILGEGIFKTVDGGETWCPLNPGITTPEGCPDYSDSELVDPSIVPFDHVEIEIFPADSDVLYASFGMCPDPLLKRCRPALYKSIDAGETWTLKLEGSIFEGSYQQCGRQYSRFTHGLAVHPTLENKLFIGGIRLCVSEDGGETWDHSDTIDVYDGSAYSVIHYDHHDMQFHPTDHTIMYDISDGGIAVSDDGGNLWSARNDDLQITGFQGLASAPNTGRVFAASQDNGDQIWQGSRIWDWKACCGDGGFTAIDYDNPQILYVGSNHGRPQKSINGGNSFYQITTGIILSEPRAFYAPIVQDTVSPAHPLYHGTNRLYRSTNDGSEWVAASEILSTDPTDPTDEIEFGVDVITAIAIAPSDPEHVYIGYYSGKVFRTNDVTVGSPDWFDCDIGVGAPVNGIAIDPFDSDTTYVVHSGFGVFARVHKTENNGVSWADADTDLPDGVPANTIVIEADNGKLWLGTDPSPDGNSLFVSTNGGDSWGPFSNGLPNAPVFQISIDEMHGRLYAATHGRGAFILGSPFLSNYEGWVDGSIWDVPVYGNNFLPNQPICTMYIYQQMGDEACAISTQDQMGGTLYTDEDGILRTSLASFYEGSPVAWACFNGACIDGTPIGDCSTEDNPLSTVIVECGEQAGFDIVLGCPSVDGPPGSFAEIDLSGLGDRRLLETGSLSFDLTASLQEASGSASLCTVHVCYDPADTEAEIMVRTTNSINESTTCQDAGIQAEVISREGGESEDEFPISPRLLLSGPDLSGGQIVTSLHASAGRTKGTCFKVFGLGMPMLNQLQIMGLYFHTTDGGAKGGHVRVMEISGLGICDIVVPTAEGMTANEVAAAVTYEFARPGIPGPHRGCPASNNLRDVVNHGDGLVTTVFATGVRICSEDEGVGFDLRPEGLNNVHPTADAGPDQTIECVRPPMSVTLDGRASTDSDGDVLSYRWYTDYNGGDQTQLASTVTLRINDLALGVHKFTLLVTDASGLSATDDIIVTVQDTVPPEITASLTPDRLWPPNHKLREVHASVIATDACDRNPTIELNSVISNEPDNSKGDGSTSGDIQGHALGTADFDFLLRSERKGRGSGRLYTAEYKATDSSGNTASISTTAEAPKHK